MFALVRGQVETVGLDDAVVLTGGVGWLVHLTPATAGQLVAGTEVTLHTHLVVREDALTLYGFLTADERACFVTLQSVSGIGPRIALAALSVLTPDDLRRAVRDQDLATLQRIPGVGRKSAQRMALEIGDKLGTPASLPGQSAAPTPASESRVESEVLAALVQLGWSEAVATRALDGLAGQGLGASDLLRAALVKLGGARG